MELDEYRKLAEVEDRIWYFRSLHEHVHRCLRRRLGDRPCDVLDAGCGTGGLLRRLRAREPAWRLTGIDLSPFACDLARGCRDTTIVTGSVTALPFAATSFDAVVSADVIYQFDDPATALRESRRCLRPGGWIVLNVPAYRWLWSYHDVAVHTRRRFTRKEIADLLEETRFDVELNTHWNALPFPLIVAKRRLFSRPGETSDVKPYPAPVEALMRSLMGLEHAWLRLGGTWAWGSSILAVGRRRA